MIRARFYLLIAKGLVRVSKILNGTANIANDLTAKTNALIGKFVDKAKARIAIERMKNG